MGSETKIFPREICDFVNFDRQIVRKIFAENPIEKFLAKSIAKEIF